jgi:hypothetical protein
VRFDTIDAKEVYFKQDLQYDDEVNREFDAKYKQFKENFIEWSHPKNKVPSPNFNSAEQTAVVNFPRRHH